MGFEQKENSGALFKNDKKTTDSQPNARGDAKINGVEYWVSAWTKKDKNGNPWQSLAFTKKDAKQAGVPTGAGKRGGDIREMPDDIPW